MNPSGKYKIMISGGGTGGHIFPAIAIAKAFEELVECEILFVGALGRMEMDKVPAAGYKIVGLPIAGLQRKFDLKNFLLPWQLIKSGIMALNQISAFNPHAVIGVGGYASAPLLIAAWAKRKPIFIQEQNAYAGLTNKWLGRVAKKVFVAFDQMDPYFPSYKMVLTGNPIRPELETQTLTKAEGCEKFKLDPKKPVLLVLGGSLGAPAINRAVAESLEKWIEEGIQVLWQTGKSGKLKADELAQKQVYNLKVFEFIYDMPEAFAAADLVVSRAGAIAITELCAQGKPSILVPSPYVAEDHQRINSSVLTRAEAAIMLEEQFISSKLAGVVLESISNKELLQKMGRNAHRIYRQGAAKSIAEHILKLTT